MSIKPIEWKDDKVIMLDQRLLPQEEVYITCEDYKAVAVAIKDMAIRGAPAIGVAAAMGVALGALGISVKTYDEFYTKLERVCETIEATRPTAVNLFWATARMKRVCKTHKDLPLSELQNRLKDEAVAMCFEDIETNRQMGRNGATFFNDGDRVLTHCNAGALATAGFGTALGVLYAATEDGKTLKVFADETRPYLQGARLTAWELNKAGIHATVITDNMTAHMMAKGEIDKVIVGADRIAANGDVTNKIGTYGVAILAKHHNIPLYVAAPMSTIDFSIPDGSHVVIEERPTKEVTHVGPTQLVPTGVAVRNPAFDVTPAALVTAIITERGIATPPNLTTLASLKK
ncbi:MAG: S-methyl-5-thioribose-1-phosphate isomerase [Deltaproteobacteria bacterium CG11_big_fil_rev_8_21_14_0_20_47_16]|nr:MAG: S-methyl-5-thioribose-1-phosphate isomerase [Deltaproteobacteria bacterium CG11_big_fil_rev_8_21_14_0_20_47_16]